jgi:hypothetical protein
VSARELHHSPGDWGHNDYARVSAAAGYCGPTQAAGANELPVHAVVAEEEGGAGAVVERGDGGVVQAVGASARRMRERC